MEKHPDLPSLRGKKSNCMGKGSVAQKGDFFFLLRFWKEASEEKRAVISNEISFALKGLAGGGGGGGNKKWIFAVFFGREWEGKTRKRADKSFFIASSYFSISGMLPPPLSPFIAGIQLLLYYFAPFFKGNNATFPINGRERDRYRCFCCFARKKKPFSTLYLFPYFSRCYAIRRPPAYAGENGCKNRIWNIALADAASRSVAVQTETEKIQRGKYRTLRAQQFPPPFSLSRVSPQLGF